MPEQIKLQLHYLRAFSRISDGLTRLHAFQLSSYSVLTDANMNGKILLGDGGWHVLHLALTLIQAHTNLIKIC